MDNPKKILVMAYAISPSRGSEYAVAWNYIINIPVGGIKIAHI